MDRDTEKPQGDADHIQPYEKQGAGGAFHEDRLQGGAYQEGYAQLLTDVGKPLALSTVHVESP